MLRRAIAVIALPLVLAACAGAPKVFGEDPGGRPFMLESVFAGQ